MSTISRSRNPSPDAWCGRSPRAHPRPDGRPLRTRPRLIAAAEQTRPHRAHRERALRRPASSVAAGAIPSTRILAQAVHPVRRKIAPSLSTIGSTASSFCEHGLQLSAPTSEITESRAVGRWLHHRARPPAPHDDGIGIAIDYFGTGVRGAARPRHLAVTSIKVFFIVPSPPGFCMTRSGPPSRCATSSSGSPTQLRLTWRRRGLETPAAAGQLCPRLRCCWCRATTLLCPTLPVLAARPSSKCLERVVRAPVGCWPIAARPRRRRAGTPASPELVQLKRLQRAPPVTGARSISLRERATKSRRHGPGAFEGPRRSAGV